MVNRRRRRSSERFRVRLVAQKAAIRAALRRATIRGSCPQLGARLTRTPFALASTSIRPIPAKAFEVKISNKAPQSARSFEPGHRIASVTCHVSALDLPSLVTAATAASALHSIVSFCRDQYALQQSTVCVEPLPRRSIRQQTTEEASGLTRSRKTVGWSGAKEGLENKWTTVGQRSSTLPPSSLRYTAYIESLDMKTFTVAINLALLHVALAGSVGKWA